MNKVLFCICFCVFLLVGISNASANPVLFYDFNEEVGTYLHDFSGSKNNAELYMYNATSVAPTWLDASTFLSSGGMRFYGNDSLSAYKLNSTMANNWSALGFNDNFTVGFRIISYENYTQSIIIANNHYLMNEGWYFDFYQGDLRGLCVNASGVRADTEMSFPENEKHTVFLTFSGGTAKLYLEKVEMDSATMAGAVTQIKPATTYPLWIATASSLFGTEIGDIEKMGNLSMDWAGVWNDVLTEDEMGDIINYTTEYMGESTPGVTQRRSGNHYNDPDYDYSLSLTETKQFDLQWKAYVTSPDMQMSAVGDIDNDGDMEIVISVLGGSKNTYNNGPSLMVYDHDGFHLWEWTASDLYYISAAPVIADLNGDYLNEIILLTDKIDGTTSNARIHVFNSTGSEVSWFNNSGIVSNVACDWAQTTPIIFDAAQVGTPQIIFGSTCDYKYRSIYSNGTLNWEYDTNSLYGYPVGLGSIEDFDNDGNYELFFGHDGGFQPSGNMVGRLTVLYASNGTLRESIVLNASGITSNTRGTMTTGDFDNDGDFEIFFGDRFGDYYCYSFDGTNLVQEWTGWFGPEIPFPNAYGDIDNDGTKEILLSNNEEGILYVINGATGAVKDSVDLCWGLTNSSIRNVHLVDVDDDGDYEIFVGILYNTEMDDALEIGDGKIFYLDNDLNTIDSYQLDEAFRYMNVADLDNNSEYEVIVYTGIMNEIASPNFIYSFNLYNYPLVPPTLFSPTNNSIIYTTYPPLIHEVIFKWHDVGAPQYRIIISTDMYFNQIFSDTWLSANSSTQELIVNEEYWWRVYSYDGSSHSNTSDLYSFNITGNTSLTGSAIEGVVYTDIGGTNTALSGAEVTIWNTTWTDTSITGSNGYYLPDNAREYVHGPKKPY